MDTDREKVSPNQLCVGVCRGSQFLCVMNGGLLVQDVGYHGVFGTHAIYNEVNQLNDYITVCNEAKEQLRITKAKYKQ